MDTHSFEWNIVLNSGPCVNPTAKVIANVCWTSGFHRIEQEDEEEEQK